MNAFGGKKSAVFVFASLILIVTIVVYVYLTRTDQHLVENFIDELHLSSLSPKTSDHTSPSQSQSISFSGTTFTTQQLDALNITCEDPVWCKVPMPSKSLFRFSTPPNDPRRWREAQRLAASGNPILLQKIIRHFPNYMDFLDGDILFRSTHMNADFFLGPGGNLSFITVPPDTHGSHVPTDVLPSNRQIPNPYYAQKFDRAPIVQAGYALFDRDGPLFFQGKKVGEHIVNLPRIILAWEKVYKDVQTPFIMVSAFNENWGLLSGLFPNRTVNWLPWPSRRAYAGLKHILDHNHTLLFLVNQHRNFTHPKLLTLPRGIPGYIENHKRFLWDLMMDEASTRDLKAKSFVFLASSNWGYRPQLKQCIARKFPTFDGSRSDGNSVEYFNSTNGLDLHGYDEKLIGRVTPYDYYRKLIRAKVSLAIPGLGYDTFRLWESLTLGVVAVVERGVGLDKTVRSFTNAPAQLQLKREWLYVDHCSLCM